LQRETFEYYWSEVNRIRHTCEAPPKEALGFASLVTRLHRHGFGATIRIAIAAIVAAPTLVLAQGVPPLIWATSAYQYDTGAAPSVAMAGGVIVEVHQIDAGAGPLHSHTGKIQLDGTVTWNTKSVKYGDGSLPSVAVSGDTVIAVHQGDTGHIGNLYYQTGTIQPDGSVTWVAKALLYDHGYAPAVAVDGSTIIEVYQATTGTGQLYFHTAEIQTDGTVVWDPSAYPYDNGITPSVGVAGSTILEVHNDGTGFFYYHSGEIQADGTVLWAASPVEYDSGVQPSVAVSGPAIVEVHQAGIGVGPLYYHTGAVRRYRAICD
jgi:hypothetical protein